MISFHFLLFPVIFPMISFPAFPFCCDLLGFSLPSDEQKQAIFGGQVGQPGKLAGFELSHLEIWKGNHLRNPRFGTSFEDRFFASNGRGFQNGGRFCFTFDKFL